MRPKNWSLSLVKRKFKQFTITSGQLVDFLLVTVKDNPISESGTADI